MTMTTGKWNKHYWKKMLFKSWWSFSSAVQNSISSTYWSHSWKLSRAYFDIILIFISIKKISNPIWIYKFLRNQLTKGVVSQWSCMVFTGNFVVFVYRDSLTWWYYLFLRISTYWNNTIFLVGCSKSSRINTTLAVNGLTPLLIARLDHQDAIARLNLLKLIKVRPRFSFWLAYVSFEVILIVTSAT